MVDDCSPEEIELAKKETKIVLVDAWTRTCGPCKELSPILEDLEQTYAEHTDLRIVKINTQNHIGFASKNNIFAIPCVLAFSDGEPAKYECLDRHGELQVVDRLVGLRPIEEYENMIRYLLGVTT